MRQHTVRFINFGNQAQQRTWQTFSRRSRVEQVLLGILSLVLVIPLLLLVIGLGALILLLGIGLGLIAMGVNWFKRTFGAGRQAPTPGRKNVRIVEPRR